MGLTDEQIAEIERLATASAAISPPPWGWTYGGLVTGAVRAAIAACNETGIEATEDDRAYLGCCPNSPGEC